MSLDPHRGTWFRGEGGGCVCPPPTFVSRSHVISFRYYDSEEIFCLYSTDTGFYPWEYQRSTSKVISNFFRILISTRLMLITQIINNYYSEWRLRMKLFWKRDDLWTFHLCVVTFQHRLHMEFIYKMYISVDPIFHLACGSYRDFCDRGLLLTRSRKLLNLEFRIG